MAKVIFHIDLNAFFATAEVINDPSLLGKPIAVGGYGRRGIISTASYEARAFGIHSAMPVFEAMAKCPDLIVIPGKMELYEKLSNAFLDLIRSLTPLVEQASIDECYADMSDVINKYAKPLDLAVEIQKRLKEGIGLTCSIGIAPNKFLAKIASDLKKPNGITILRLKELETKLWPLDISAMGGIGKKTAPQLKRKGIKVIGDLLIEENRFAINKILGNNANVFIDYAKGIDNDSIENFHEIKSLSQSTTFIEDLVNYDDIYKEFNSLVKELHDRVREYKVCGNNVSIVIKYNNFDSINRCMRLAHFTNSYVDILDACMALYEANDQGIPIRLLGVALNNLKGLEYLKEFDLFNYSSEENKIDSIINTLNNVAPNAKFKKLSDLVQKSEFKGIFHR